MKVLQINNVHYRRGGADAVYLNTAELLREHGEEVVFFNILKAKNLPCKDDKYWISSVESRGSGLRSQLRELHNFFYNQEAERKIEELVLSEKPEIAHIHLFWGSGISPSITNVLKRHHIPLVHTVHDYRMICPIALLLDKNGNVCERCEGKNFYKAGLYGCSKHGRVRSVIMAAEMYYHNRRFNPLDVVDGFIFVSNFSYTKHLQYMPQLADANTTVLYNFALKGDSIASEDTSYLLYYGRLSHEKGVESLLSAVKGTDAIQLKIVGTGPLEKEFKGAYKDCSNITFLGYQTGDTLKRIVRNARFVCIPSVCYENNPMTIVEAYSMGTPVIGSRIGGIPEIVVEGETGFGFEAGNVEDLKHTITRAYTMKEMDYTSMRNNAFSFYEKHFSPEQHYKRLVGFYKQTIEKYEQ